MANSETSHLYFTLLGSVGSGSPTVDWVKMRSLGLIATLIASTAAFAVPKLHLPLFGGDTCTGDKDPAIPSTGKCYQGTASVFPGSPVLHIIGGGRVRVELGLVVVQGGGMDGRARGGVMGVGRGAGEDV